VTRSALVLAVAALLATACSSGGPDGAALNGRPGSTVPGPTTTVDAQAGSPVVLTPAPPPGEGALVTPTGVVVPVASKAEGGWNVTTPCQRTVTLTGGTHVPTATVVLDPGHGGADPGAVSTALGLKESTVNLAVSQHTKAALEAAGFSVLLTRTGDYNLNLAPRADIAKAVGARVFASIHHNAEPDGPWPRPGAETYYQIASADSKRLSGLVYEEVLKTMSQYNIEWVADTDAGAKYRPGSRGDYYAMLRQPAPVVSTLVELAFISNPAEAALLARPEVQKAEGEAVARGIVRYLTTRDPGSGFTEPYPRPTPPAGPGGGTPPPCPDPPLT